MKKILLTTVALAAISNAAFAAPSFVDNVNTRVGNIYNTIGQDSSSWHNSQGFSAFADVVYKADNNFMSASQLFSIEMVDGQIALTNDDIEVEGFTGVDVETQVEVFVDQVDSDLFGGADINSQDAYNSIDSGLASSYLSEIIDEIVVANKTLANLHTGETTAEEAQATIAHINSLFAEDGKVGAFNAAIAEYNDPELLASLSGSIDSLSLREGATSFIDNAESSTADLTVGDESYDSYTDYLKGVTSVTKKVADAAEVDNVEYDTKTGKYTVNGAAVDTLAEAKVIANKVATAEEDAALSYDAESDQFTVQGVSFDTEEEAQSVLDIIEDAAAIDNLSYDAATESYLVQGVSFESKSAAQPSLDKITEVEAIDGIAYDVATDGYLAYDHTESMTLAQAKFLKSKYDNASHYDGMEYNVTDDSYSVDGVEFDTLVDANVAAVNRNAVADYDGISYDVATNEYTTHGYTLYDSYSAINAYNGYTTAEAHDGVDYSPATGQFTTHGYSYESFDVASSKADNFAQAAQADGVGYNPSLGFTTNGKYYYSTFAPAAAQIGWTPPTVASLGDSGITEAAEAHAAGVTANDQAENAAVEAELAEAAAAVNAAATAAADAENEAFEEQVATDQAALAAAQDAYAAAGEVSEASGNWNYTNGEGDFVSVPLQEAIDNGWTSAE